jgi:hypothetical protein
MILTAVPAPNRYNTTYKFTYRIEGELYPWLERTYYQIFVVPKNGQLFLFGGVTFAILLCCFMACCCFVCINNIGKVKPLIESHLGGSKKSENEMIIIHDAMGNLRFYKPAPNTVQKYETFPTEASFKKDP